MKQSTKTKQKILDCPLKNILRVLVKKGPPIGFRDSDVIILMIDCDDSKKY